MAGFDPEKITFFAKTDTRGQQVPFGIKAKDRQRHMYVIGKTGMGKSTLLENMAAQDIANGEGMAFIDPHGSAIEVLLDYIPEHRLDDVVYFAPFDMDNPVAFNIMEDVGVDTRHLVVSGLMSTFKKIWEDAWSARMEYILTNALLALIEYPNTTLLSVNRMLADKEYRDKVIENVKDPAVKAYWIDEFNNYTERFAAEALPAIQNKIGQFTGNPLIRNIIGQPKSSFDVRKMMDEKKILLINLSKGLVGETNADLIGSMLITKIYLAAMSRAELSPAQMKQMPNFYFYVDEFQSFANSTFANILSEARKYHLNLIIAHQYVAQMEDKIRDAVFGNVGTTVAFRTGPFDAEVLETVFAPQFEAVDLVNLGFAQICLTLMIDGVGSTPFSARTLAPVETPPTSHKHMAIKRSQQNYSKPRSEVEKLVVDSHAPVERLETAVEKGSGNKGGFTKPSAFFKVGTETKPAPKKGNAAHDNKKQSTQAGDSQNSPKPANQPPQKTTTTSDQSKPPENRPTDNKDRKPKPPEKTAEDLKAILAGMVGQQSAQPANQPPQKTTTTSDQSKPPANRPTDNKDRKPKPPEKTAEDLKAILAGVVGKQNTQQQQTQEKKPIDPKPQLREQRKKESNPPQQTQPVPKKESLKSALSSLFDDATSEVVSEKGGSDSENFSPRQIRDRQQQMLKADREKNNESGYKKRIESKQGKSDSVQSQETSQQQSAPETDGSATEPVKQSSEPAIGGHRQPAFTPVEYASEPDIATVKQILRTSGKERPPGI